MTEDMRAEIQMEGLVKGGLGVHQGSLGVRYSLSPMAHPWDLASGLISTVAPTPPSQLCPSQMRILPPGRHLTLRS